jgi:tetratricopeptide (TPR) repeat protein
MGKIIYTLSLLLYASTFCFSQKNTKYDSLCFECVNTKSESEKIAALNNLKNYCYNKKYLRREGDSVFHEQLRIAKSTGDKTLILNAYFNNSVADIEPWSSNEEFRNATGFLRQAIDHAKKMNENYYLVTGYLRLAFVLRKKGDLDEALVAATTGIPVLDWINNDSLKAALYIEMGEIYRTKGIYLPACTYYNRAYDIAVKENKYPLQSDIHHRFSNLYKELGDFEEANTHLQESIKINTENENPEGLVKDNIDLARLTDDTFYAQKALQIAESQHMENHALAARRVLFSIYMLQGKSEKTLEYFNSNEELKESFTKRRKEDYNITMGEIFRYGNQPDLALNYFILAENELSQSYGVNNTRALLLEIAACYELKNTNKKAIEYYSKALPYFNESEDISSRQYIASHLSVLYKKEQRLDTALFYQERSASLKDSIQQLSHNKELALLGVSRENRQHDEELLQIRLAQQRSYNRQYQIIAIVICLVLIVALILGSLRLSPKVSKYLLPLIPYIFFIGIVEFILLLFETKFLHDFTHGEPLVLWIIKILLIATIIPAQHALEHWLTKFLQSRGLEKIRINLFSWLWSKKTRPAKTHIVASEKNSELLPNNN